MTAPRMGRGGGSFAVPAAAIVSNRPRRFAIVEVRYSNRGAPLFAGCAARTPFHSHPRRWNHSSIAPATTRHVSQKAGYARVEPVSGIGMFMP